MDLEMLQACLVVALGSVAILCFCVAFHALGKLLLGIGLKDDDE